MIKHNHTKLSKKLKRGKDKIALVIILVQRIRPRFALNPSYNDEPLKIRSLLIFNNCYNVYFNIIMQSNNVAIKTQLNSFNLNLPFLMYTTHMCEL